MDSVILRLIKATYHADWWQLQYIDTNYDLGCPKSSYVEFTPVHSFTRTLFLSLSAKKGPHIRCSNLVDDDRDRIAKLQEQIKLMSFLQDARMKN